MRLIVSDRGQIAVAGVIHQHIDLPETFIGLPDDIGDLPRYGHVQGGDQRVPGQGKFVQSRRVACRHDDAVAAAQQRSAEFAAETGRATGDQPDGIGGRHGQLA